MPDVRRYLMHDDWLLLSTDHNHLRWTRAWVLWSAVSLLQRIFRRWLIVFVAWSVRSIGLRVLLSWRWGVPRCWWMMLEARRRILGWWCVL